MSNKITSGSEDNQDLPRHEEEKYEAMDAELEAKASEEPLAASKIDPDDDTAAGFTSMGQFKWDKDLAAIVNKMAPSEIRFLVDAYYMLQDNRKRAASQVSSLEDHQEPNEIMKWLNNGQRYLETQVAKALAGYAEQHPVGQWALDQVGIGPIITSGLLAYIKMDPTSQTVGQMWRFAGQDPEDKWLGRDGAEKLMDKLIGPKGAAKTDEQFAAIAEEMRRKPDWVSQRLTGLSRTDQEKVLARRPWNAGFKVLVYKIGDSFLKCSNIEGCYYGKVYKNRMAYETAKNERLEYKDQAARILIKCKGKHAQKAIYETGMLPKGHILSRCKRYAAKMFLAHFWEKYYWHVNHKAPPVPYAVAHCGHAHVIPPPPGGPEIK